MADANGGIDGLYEIINNDGSLSMQSINTSSVAGRALYSCIMKSTLIPNAQKLKATAVSAATATDAGGKVGAPLVLERSFIPKYDENMLYGSVGIFTDGASSKPKGHEKFYGGTGVVAVNHMGEENEQVMFTFKNGNYDSTVSMEELNAMIIALKYILNNYKTDDQLSNPLMPIFIVADSEYVLKGLCLYYPNTWKKSSWKLAGGAPVKNLGHWKEIINLVDMINNEVPNPSRIKFVHTFGHADVKYNEYADKLAVEGRKEIFAKMNK